MTDATRILVIDDEELICRSCLRILEDAGLEASCVSRGREGLELLERESFDAVLLDLKMPGVGGPEVLSRIRETHEELPLIVFTGYATVETKRQCLSLGASAWLPKPFTPDELLDAIRRALGKE